MLSCGVISANLVGSCETPLITGVRRRVWVGDLTKLDGYDVNLSNIMIIELLNYNGILQKIVGYDDSVQPTYNSLDSGFVKVFDHRVNCKNFDLTAQAKEIIEGAKSGVYFVIVENLDLSFEVYGIDAGLKITEIARDPNSADTQGAFDITFFTAKNKEPRHPRNIDLGNYADTLAYIESLEETYGGFSNGFSNGFNN